MSGVALLYWLAERVGVALWHIAISLENYSHTLTPCYTSTLSVHLFTTSRQSTIYYCFYSKFNWIETKSKNFTPAILIDICGIFNAINYPTDLSKLTAIYWGRVLHFFHSDNCQNCNNEWMRARRRNKIELLMVMMIENRLQILNR